MEITVERMIVEYCQDYEIYLEHMTRYFFASQFVKDKTVLDMACGSGYGTNYLATSGAQAVWGFDISEEAVSYCKKNYANDKLLFGVGSIEKIPLQNHKIDVAVSMETIEHVNEIIQNEFLKEVKRVMKPEGIFIISTPNALVFPKGTPFHYKEFYLHEFENLLKEYFPNVIIYYQDSIVSNYILNKDTLNKEILKNNDSKITLRKINTIDSAKSLYFLAVCSNSERVMAIDEHVTLFNIKPEVQKMQYELAVKEQAIAARDAQILSMEQSLSWRLTSPLRKLDHWLHIRNRK